ncbi:MAG: SRPBCC family protein [Chloroflexi bacterium]|nr:SRPBCC family protein [Chloroflexota bacterium]
MIRTHISAERVMDAPADVVYCCIADYRQHHRPSGFLPPAFSDFRIERGGVGVGTVMSFTVMLGGRRRRMRHEVNEPEPGRVLVEGGPRERTTFTVDPQGAGCRVRIDTLLVGTGLDGWLTRLAGPALMRPLFLDELARLERYARSVAAI